MEFPYHPNPTYIANEGASVTPDEQVNNVYGGIDNSSRYVGAVVLAAFAVLLGMKILGFRFSFGVAGGR